MADTIASGATKAFKVVAIPAGATLPADIAWSIADEAVATIEADGANVTVTAVAAGATTLNVSAGTFTASDDLTVTAPEATGIQITAA